MAENQNRNDAVSRGRKNQTCPEVALQGDNAETTVRRMNFSGALAASSLLIMFIGGYLIARPLGALPFGSLSFGSFSASGLAPGASLTLLFFIGLLTSVHCVSMCGGFVLSCTGGEIAGASQLSCLRYGIGKLISYTLIGALFGLFGSFVAFTPALRSATAIIAGIFLILFGLRTLNIFPVLRRLYLPIPNLLSGQRAGQRQKSPFVVGLLNGLMLACGPLQAMYVYAAATGSLVLGAASLFAFGLGTLPALFGFGLLALYVSKSSLHRVLRFSGLVVIAFGILMLNSGLALAGTGYDFNSLRASFSPAGAAVAGAAFSGGAYQVIEMNVTAGGWEPDRFLLRRGVPVKWVIDGKELTGCNNAIQVPKLGLEFDIRPGKQTIEFTPAEAGIIPWSCWMGMIQGVFIVQESSNQTDAEAKAALAEFQVPRAEGTCGCGRR